MALYLVETRDQALLTLIIEEARAVANEKGAYVGRTALQKITYFLKVTGIPMDYKFDIYTYGPFSEAILRDIDWLLADEVIEDHSTNTEKYSNYYPGATADELLRLHESALNPYRTRIQQVVRALVPLNPNHLELLSTLDFLYRAERATGRTSEWKEAIVHRFMAIKGKKFSVDVVEKTYDNMASIGLVQA